MTTPNELPFKVVRSNGYDETLEWGALRPPASGFDVDVWERLLELGGQHTPSSTAAVGSCSPNRRCCPERRARHWVAGAIVAFEGLKGLPKETCKGLWIRDRETLALHQFKNVGEDR